MAQSKMVKLFISNDGKVENQNEKIVDAYNALEYIKDIVNDELEFSFSSFMDATLPEIDSIIGALQAIKKFKDEECQALNEALKLI